METHKAALVYRQTRSWHGIRADELKSHMQKSVRRGNFEEASKALASMTNLLTLFPGQTLAKSIRTNAINRVIVCALEDVGVTDLSVVVAVLRSLIPMTWKQKRRVFDLETVVGCLRLLCDAKKTRVMSWLFHAYGAGCNSALAVAQGLPVELVVDLRSLPLSNPNCFQCIEKGQQDLVMERFEREVGGQLATWLCAAHRNLSERRPAVALALASQHFGLSANPVSVPAVAADWLHRLETHQFELEVMDDALDKHTATGRALAEMMLQLQAERRKSIQLESPGSGGWFGSPSKEVEELRAKVTKLTEASVQHQLQNAELNREISRLEQELEARSLVPSQAPRADSEELLRRLFFTLAQNRKLQQALFPSATPLNVDIQELWEEVQLQGVHFTRWEAFLDSKAAQQ